MAKKIALNLLKLLLAVGLLVWLVGSGKLNWDLLIEMRRYPHRLLLAFAFGFLSLFLVSWRFRFLLSARASGPIGVFRLMTYNWIGMFFSSVLPGSVTGDLVKVFYVQKLDRNFSKTFVLFACLFDRIMGLTGLILMMGVFSLANYSALIGLSPKLAPLLTFNFLLLAAVVFGLVVYFVFPARLKALLDAVAARIKLPFVARIGQLWEDLALVRPQIGRALCLSIVVQIFSVVIFYLLVSPQFVTPLSLPMALSFIPLGFMAIALPISPAGLGVGHAAFEGLFAMAGEPNGANFFNMYFVVSIFFNLLGVIPWLGTRSRSGGPAE